METSNVNLKNWKSLIKPSKIDVDQNEDKTFAKVIAEPLEKGYGLCLLYTSPSPRDRTRSRMPSSA